MASFVVLLVGLGLALLVLRFVRAAVVRHGPGVPVFLADIPRTEREWQDREAIVFRDWPEDS